MSKRPLPIEVYRELVKEGYKPENVIEMRYNIKLHLKDMRGILKINPKMTAEEFNTYCVRWFRDKRRWQYIKAGLLEVVVTDNGPKVILTDKGRREVSTNE